MDSFGRFILLVVLRLNSGLLSGSRKKNFHSNISQEIDLEKKAKVDRLKIVRLMMYWCGYTAVGLDSLSFAWSIFRFCKGVVMLIPCVNLLHKVISTKLSACFAKIFFCKASVLTILLLFLLTFNIEFCTSLPLVAAMKNGFFRVFVLKGIVLAPSIFNFFAVTQASFTLYFPCLVSCTTTTMQNVGDPLLFFLL